MEVNSYLVAINHAILIRDESAIHSHCAAILKILADGGPEPSWGWNSLLTRNQFNTLSVVCPRCQKNWKLESKGLFGCSCVCSGCYQPDIEQFNIVGKGSTLEDSVKEWFQLMSKTS